jgi:serine/threonine protein kinase
MSPIRNNSCCPTFLVAVVGPWICILGAVFVDHVVIQELTDFIWIGGHPYDDDKLKSVTRILAALGKGITELEGFYANLPHHKSPDPQRFFPFIRQYSVGERIVRFSYKAYLLRKNPEIHAKPIFLATIESGGEGERSRDVVVKFVQTYNARAHRLLAAAGYAPELLYCSTEDPHSEDLGGLVMAIMEYVPGKTAHERYGNNPLPQAIFNQVRNAVETLHTENIVFADLRPPNIMVTGDERVMLIDFDWCGVHQKGTYPISLNDVQESDISIDWHPDVKRGGRMMKEHDIYRLNTMKPQS